MTVLIAAGVGLALAGLVGGGARLAMRAHSRSQLVPQLVSGAPVLKKAADGADVRWHESTTTIYFDRSLAELAPGAVDAVQSGFGTWIGSDARVPDLSFDTTHQANFGKTPNGRSEISYGRITLPGHEHDLALTITFSDASTGEIVEADMIFNSEHSFGLLKSADSHHAGSEAADCNDKYDLQAVATHEAGHFFGLGEDFDQRLATMYFTTGRCELHKRVLTDSDVTTMSGLYLNSDVAAKAPAGKGCALAPAGSETDSSSPAYAGLVLLGIAAARRRRR
ncbi:MAG TPA: matrixin family metalloprotease [Polyangiaceae bacterium]